MKAIKCFVVACLFFCRLVAAGPGSLDLSFAPRLDGAISDMVNQPDGKILICGAFGHVNGVVRNGIARLWPDGSLDTNFFSTAVVSAPTLALALQGDGKVLVGGDFTSIAGTQRAHLARLNTDGTLDSTFPVSAGVNSTVTTIVIQPDAKILIGGSFTSLQNNTARRAIVRFNSDGTLDADFNSSTAIAGTVTTLAVQADGKIVIGGTFTSAFGVIRNRIARLLPNGLIDLAFQDNMTGANAIVRSIALQPDGKALVGGDFTLMNNQSRQRIVRLNLDGSLDSTFNTASAASGAVYTILTQPDKNILIGGQFTSYRAAARRRLARIFTDSQVDPTFSAASGEGAGSGQVQKIAIQPDGSMLVGGSFLTYSGIEGRAYLVRIYGDLYPPEIIRQPVRRSVQVGSSVTFSVLISNPLPVGYQWRKNGIDILNANGNSFTLSNVQTGDSGNYSVFISNAAGSVTSTNVFLYVGISPAITEQPHDLTVNAGQDAQFQITATGSDLIYTWHRDGLVIAGATNSTLVITNATVLDEGIYQAFTSNPIDSLPSITAILHVLSKPIIMTEPATFSFEVNGVLPLEAKVLGDPPPQLQWFKDGVAIASQTNSTYIIAPTKVSDSGAYDVLASNEYGSVTGRIANITILYHPPELTRQPQGGLVRIGDPIGFFLSATGTEPLTWQWFKGAEKLAATTGTLMIEHASQTDSGDYFAVVSNPGGTNTSLTAHIEVGLPPTITAQPADTAASRGGSVQLSVGYESTHPATLQWLVNNNVIAGATNTTLIITNLLPSNTGEYSVSVQNIFGSTNSGAARASVIGFAFDEWNGLVGFWPFSGNGNDIAGTNNAIVHGAVLTADYLDKADSAYSFDGSSYVEIPNAPELNPGTNNFTLMFWEMAPTTEVNRYIAAKYSTGEAGSYGIGTENQGFAYAFTWPVESPVYYENRGSISISDGSWHHIALVISNQYILLHHEGILSGVSGTTPGNITNGLPLLIGRSASGQNFVGAVDDVRVYNRALSEAEIRAVVLRDTHLAAARGPASLTVTNGQTATFTITIPADAKANFQWMKDGAVIEGATNSTLVISNVSPRDIGSYHSDIYNRYTGTNSPYATLSVEGFAFDEWWQLLAYFPFDGNATDLGPLNLQATASNVSPTADRRGQSNGALLFDGATSDVSINDAVFQIGGPYTISLWFKSDDVTVRNQALFNTIPHNGLYLSFEHELWPGGVSARIGDGASWISPHYGGGMTNFHNGVWHHLVFVKGLYDYWTYIDGRLDDSEFFRNISVSGLEGFRFGTTGGPEYLKGAIDEVRIFRRWMGPTEVFELYNLEAATAQRINASVRMSATDLVVSFDMEANTSYSLFATESLDTPAWIKIVDFDAQSSAGVTEVRRPIGAEPGQHFYRIVSPAQP